MGGRDVVLDLLRDTSSFPRVYTNEFMKFWELKESIELQSFQVFSNMTVLNTVLSDLAKQTTEIQYAQKRKQSLKDYEFMDRKDVKQWNLIDQSHYTTLSGVPGMNCHEHCNLAFTPEPNSDIFKGCAAMYYDQDKGDHYCKVCGLRWDK